ncbi:hypothetical protein M513_08379 [Trichuris suis]|uniref:HAT C-terminal dimerisation domain-containing protein n=1 Tax=Trichuris suis TaxID=68888 RepID=A0A085M0H7_9BILA|nr:hypothetical protein M513_08379 [Trichuris suis]
MYLDTVRMHVGMVPASTVQKQQHLELRTQAKMFLCLREKHCWNHCESNAFVIQGSQGVPNRQGVPVGVPFDERARMGPRSRQVETDWKCCHSAADVKDAASLTENLWIRKADVAYLADLYFMFNGMNKQLLTEDLNLIKTKSVISAFMSKLLLFKRRFAMGELCQFQNLIEMEKEGQASDADVEVYREHLRALHNDFARRFEDIRSIVIPEWVINPFTNVEDEEISLQIELLDLQSNAELKPRLAEGYRQFWLRKQIPVLYPTVWAVVKRWLICLPSSSLMERAFSLVTDLITKNRNRLQLVKRGDLRLRVTSILPNIDKLVRSQLCQPSTSR